MKKLLLVAGTITVAGFLYACGGSSSNSTGGSGSGITTTVAAPAISTQTAVTSTNAAKTVNASKTLASSFASGSSFPSLGSLVGKPAADQAANSQRIMSTVRSVQQQVAGIVKKQKAVGKQVAAAQSAGCTDGGTMSFDTTSDPVIITFTDCKEDYEYKNGTVSMPKAFMGQTSSTSSFSLTVNMTTITYPNLGIYTSPTNKSDMFLTMTVSSFDSTSGAMKLAMNGTQSEIYYTGTGSSEKQSFGNFSIDMTESLSGSLATTSMTLNGSVSMDTFKDTTFTTIDTASGMTFQSLILVETVNSSSTALRINGTFAIKTIPACNDGTFAITTQSDITTNSIGATTGGQMTVNGVVMVFNADGSVTATINGTPQTITSYATACSLSF